MLHWATLMAMGSRTLYQPIILEPLFRYIEIHQKADQLQQAVSRLKLIILPVAVLHLLHLALHWQT